MYQPDPTYFTKHGTPIAPVVPAQYRGDGKAKYRLCQILPPNKAGQKSRYEWIHVYNIMVKHDGKLLPYEQNQEPVHMPEQHA